MTHSCDDPIRCSTCLAVKSAKATKRRTAARKSAEKRKQIAARKVRGRCSDSAPGQDVAS